MYDQLLNDYEGKIITVKDLLKFPPRNDFLDKEIFSETRSRLKDKKPIEFLANDILETFLPEKKNNSGKWELYTGEYANRNFKIAMFGILKSGETVTVILDGIMPYFEIRIPNGQKSDSYLVKIRQICDEQQFKVREYTIVDGLTFKEYKDEASFIQLKFSSLSQRKNALKYFDLQNYETYHDEASSYYRVFSRDVRISYTSWLTLKNYQVIKNHTYFNTDIVIQLDYMNISQCTADILNDFYLKNDRTLIECNDIETWDTEEKLASTDVPHYNSPSADMFFVGMSYSWHDSKYIPVNELGPDSKDYKFEKPEGYLFMIGFTTVPIDPLPGRILVYCQNQGEIIDGIGLIRFKLKPQNITDFNGSNYDQPWITNEARKHRKLEYFEKCMSTLNLQMYRNLDAKSFIQPRDIQSYYYFKSYQFKVTAELMLPGEQLCYPGYLNIDLMPQLRKMYGNPEKFGLKAFLEKCKLGSKVDMPYQKMFAIYECSKIMKSMVKGDIYSDQVKEMIYEHLGLLELYKELKRQMSYVGEYCMIDAGRCQDLLVKNAFIREKRGLGDLSYTSMHDCVNKADGMKVRNLTVSYAQTRNIHASTKAPKNVEEGKYPGAYVVPPKKGVFAPKLTILDCLALAHLGTKDFQSWLNCNKEQVQDMCKTIRKYGCRASKYNEEIFSKHPKCFKNWIMIKQHLPVAGLDFSSLYPSLIMAYNLSPEMMLHSQLKALKLASEGKDLHRSCFKFNGREIEGWSVRHKYKYNPYPLVDKDGKKYEDPENAKMELPEVEFGVFPSILLILFNLRADIKAEVKPLKLRTEHLETLPKEELLKHKEEYDKLKFRIQMLTIKEKAVKVYMNTFYGESGNKRSPLRVLALAGGVTSAGQYNLKKVIQYVKSLGCEVYYGDSVLGDTPILCKFENKIKISTFDSIANWKNTQTDKQISYEWNQIEVWSKDGWTAVKSVVRHKTDKKIFRISTHTGTVDVTEDHSLLNEEGIEVKPNDVKIGYTLFHNYPIFDIVKTNITNTNNCYFTNGCKDAQSNIVSECLLNADIDEKYLYIKGYYSVNSNLKTVEKKYAAILYYLMKSIGFNVIINERDGYFNIQVINDYDTSGNKTIKSILELPNTQEYVYDITTENHTFQAGIGEMIVHNTDSCYISMNEDAFFDIECQYYSGEISRQEFIKQAVEISFNEIKAVNKGVNDMLFKDNGTMFLRMAYEEFLYPGLMSQKKKYAGIPHENIFNANPKEHASANDPAKGLFVKGLDLVKKGVSGLLKDVGIDILWKVFDYNNLRPLIEIVEDKVKECYSSEHKISDFIKTAQYRPNKKQNTHSFVERMKQLDLDPAPLERFRYVMVKKNPYIYDVRGRKSQLKVADRMEYDWMVEQEHMEIDLDYYMEKNVAGLLAGLIVYHNKFDVKPADDSEEEYKKAEKKSIAVAKKYIIKICQKYGNKYVSKDPIMKKIFSMSNQVFQEICVSIYGPNIASILDINILEKKKDDESIAIVGYTKNNTLFDKIITGIEKQCNIKGKVEADAFIKSMSKKNIDQLLVIKRIYKTLLDNRKEYFVKYQSVLSHKIRIHASYMRLLMDRKNTILKQIIDEIAFANNVDDYNGDMKSFKLDDMDPKYTIIINTKIADMIPLDELDIVMKFNKYYESSIALYKNIYFTQYVLNKMSNLITSKIGMVNLDSNDNSFEKDKFAEYVEQSYDK
jgi:DNA polymerase elongation subunit (family B)